MKSISNFFTRILFGRVHLYFWATLSLFFCFGFSTYYFDRVGYSKILAILLVCIFALSFLRLIAKRDFKIDPCFLFCIITLLVVQFSNLIFGIFSYSFIILLLVGYSSYLFSKLGSFHAHYLLLATVLGASLAFSFVFLHYWSHGFQGLMDSYFGNPDRLSSAASSYAFLLPVIVQSLYQKTKNKWLLVACVFVIPYLLIMLLFRRIGAFLKFGLLIYGFLLYCLWRKKVRLFWAVFLISGIVFLAFPFSVRWLPDSSRIKASIYQLLNLDLFIEGSVRERTLMLFRDIVSALRFPAVGLGENGALAFNVIPSHNIFGSIGQDYGLFLALVLLMFSLAFLRASLKRKELFPIAFYFFVSSCFSAIYGTSFLSRTTYITFGALFTLLDVSFLETLKKYRRKLNNVYGG